MKLKNEALQELYDTIVNGTFTFSPYAEDPIDKAFKECDDCIGNLQNSNDILEKSNGTLLGANLDLCGKNHDLKNRIKQLEKDHESDVKVIGKLHSQMVDLEDEKTEQEKRADILKSQRDMLKSQLDGALEAKKAINDSRYKWAQKWLSTKKNLETKLNEAERKLDELTSQYQKLTIENKRLQNNVRSGYDQGQTDLWVKLQKVNNTQPFELATCFPDVTGMEDILNWDLEDFLDAYKKWYEEKETDRMRDWLADFCYGRVCEGCPLESNEYKCGCGYSFRKAAPYDIKIIPDKDIKRYYEKALKDGKLFDSKTMEGVNKAISKACENFCKAVRDTDIKIKENIPRNAWECTLEANVELNRDLVEKAFGIKLEEEHKLEYGDAVRVPWRNHDYMYIGPEGKHIRLFDPKTHDVVLVSVTENLTYQGCKIVLCDELDLRKIWKDKK
jgi:hypothetical protein